MPATRTYEFVLSVEVEEDHVAFDDPEWIADAAWGALTKRLRARLHLRASATRRGADAGRVRSAAGASRSQSGAALGRGLPRRSR